MTPIHSDLEGWWFWDETWTNRIGPFKSKEESEIAINHYAKYLDGETIPDDSPLKICKD